MRVLFHLEIPNCDPLKFMIGQPSFISSLCVLEVAIKLQMVNNFPASVYKMATFITCRYTKDANNLEPDQA